MWGIAIIIGGILLFAWLTQNKSSEDKKMIAGWVWLVLVIIDLIAMCIKN